MVHRRNFQVLSGASRKASLLGRIALAAVALLICMLSKGFEDKFPFRQVRRDHTATIISTGTGMDKRLMVNGIGITILTPITKMMAHLPTRIPRPPATIRVNHLLRNGDKLPLDAILEYIHDGSRPRTERLQNVFVLPR
jgi:hypothetical protein